MAVLLARAGLRATLVARSFAQAAELKEKRENSRYLPGVALPQGVRVAALEGRWQEALARSDLVFLAVPSRAVGEVARALAGSEVPGHAGVVSLVKGLVPPDGTPPTTLLAEHFGRDRIACVGGPAHAREMVEAGAGLVCAAWSASLAHSVAAVFQAAGVVCEVSADPAGVELAGVAKNAAAVAVGATREQGLNAAGMAAADIFREVLALAERRGADARTFVGRAGTGDLVATALAPSSRNRTAGELLARGVPASEIPQQVGQAVEALDTVRLLARAIEREGLDAPVTSALARLIEGTLPLDRWVALVRAQQPPPASFRRPRSWLLRLRYLARRMRGVRRERPARYTR